MTFRQWLAQEMRRAFGAYHSPVRGRLVRFETAIVAERARQLEVQRLEREGNARLLHAWRLGT